MVKQVAITVVTLCREKEAHEFFMWQENILDILCLHVYRGSGDKWIKHFPGSICNL